MKPLIIILNTILIFSRLNSFSQSTPDELGSKVFWNFKNQTISYLDSLIPSRKDMYVMAQNIGLADTTKQFIEAINKYDIQLEAFHEKVNEIYSDTSNNLRWNGIELDKILSKKDSIQLDNRDPNSKKVEIRKLSIYFSYEKNYYLIIIDDTFIVNGRWKIGNNIYLNRLKKKT